MCVCVTKYSRLTRMVILRRVLVYRTAAVVFKLSTQSTTTPLIGVGYSLHPSYPLVFISAFLYIHTHTVFNSTTVPYIRYIFEYYVNLYTPSILIIVLRYMFSVPDGWFSSVYDINNTYCICYFSCKLWYGVNSFLTCSAHVVTPTRPSGKR